jgi:hypothetical protein
MGLGNKRTNGRVPAGHSSLFRMRSGARHTRPQSSSTRSGYMTRSGPASVAADIQGRRRSSGTPTCRWKKNKLSREEISRQTVTDLLAPFGKRGPPPGARIAIWARTKKDGSRAKTATKVRDLVLANLEAWRNHSKRLIVKRVGLGQAT